MYSCVSNIGEKREQTADRKSTGQSASTHRSNPVVVVVIEVVVTCVPSLLAFKSKRLSRKHEEGQHLGNERWFVSRRRTTEGLLLLPRKNSCCIIHPFKNNAGFKSCLESIQRVCVCVYDKRTYTE